jgi:hypothetical protein
VVHHIIEIMLSVRLCDESASRFVFSLLSAF